MTNKLLFLILLLFLSLSFLTLPRNPLQNDDAALYALAAKNAVVHNQWLAQFVSPGDLSSFLDKPPLGIWLIAWPMKLFGVSELNVHIPNVLYFVILLGLIYFSLLKLAGRKLALYSTLIAATSLCLVVYSRAPKLDVLLTLFVFTAHISLYAFLKKNNPAYLIPHTLSLAAGFLIKSGFGLLLPALTTLFLLAFNRRARQTVFTLRSTLYVLLSVIVLVLIVGAVLFAQRAALGDQWIEYLKSITIQSKYNTSYTGFGFYSSVFGFLLITIFPWTPFALTAIKLPFKKLLNSPHLSVGNRKSTKLTLSDFCSFWFWSNILFLLFFYRQNDLRTFTVFVPPLAILAGLRLLALFRKPTTKTPAGWQAGRGFLIFWALFFLTIFSIIFAYLLINPLNHQGFSLSAAVLPIGLFVVSLALIAFFCLKPSKPLLAVCFAFTALSYSVLFYNTKPIADAFNPDLKWPGIIAEQRDKGTKFYIYRPPDRKLFYSPDLFWVDFMAGPADRYFWDKNELKGALRLEKALILSDTESWNKLKVKRAKVLAQDDYSLLVIK